MLRRRTGAVSGICKVSSLKRLKMSEGHSSVLFYCRDRHKTASLPCNTCVFSHCAPEDERDKKNDAVVDPVVDNLTT